MSGRPNAAIGRWISRELDRAPPRAKSLVATVWGDAVAPHGGSVWLSGLIRLLAPLGLNERLVRTSVYRLSREGWLAKRQTGRRSLYRLTAQGRHRFENAYRRIYAAPSEAWDGSWDLIVVPPVVGDERGKLRRELAWEGFGAIGAGVYARPARTGQTTAAEIVRTLGRSHRVLLLRSREVQPAAMPLAALLKQCWDLEGLDADYRRFIARFRRVVELFRDDSTGPDPAQCFVVRTLLIHEFRRVTLHDPQLPAAMLPPRWPARDAYALCRDFYRQTHRCAEQHLAMMLEAGRGPLPPAAPYFYQRFGGLETR
ncbi:MAG TPA: phenylacetic acid degradation operon negative regulatory protein PaaX [Casimicrobiaceae bacterium]|jgi:phenylacetic acid degradation operon negative regulatory protein